MKKITFLLLSICLLSACNSKAINKGLTFEYSYDDIADVSIYSNGQNRQPDINSRDTETVVESIFSVILDDNSDITFIDVEAQNVPADDVVTTYEKYVTISFKDGKEITYTDEKEYKYDNVTSITLMLMHKKDDGSISSANIFLNGADYEVYFGIFENTPKLQEAADIIDNTFQTID